MNNAVISSVIIVSSGKLLSVVQVPRLLILILQEVLIMSSQGPHIIGLNIQLGKQGLHNIIFLSWSLMCMHVVAVYA